MNDKRYILKDEDYTKRKNDVIRLPAKILREINAEFGVGQKLSMRELFTLPYYPYALHGLLRVEPVHYGSVRYALYDANDNILNEARNRKQMADIIRHLL